MADNYTQAPLDYLASYLDHVAETVGSICESPIEKGMLRAFAALRLVDRRIVIVGFQTGLILTEWSARIIPQYVCDQYRLDFAVHITDDAGLSEWIGVECDGHDYHERTREQAARDKARDRTLTNKGFRILRFTGSEIYRDNMGCALQVYDLIVKLGERAA